MLWQIDLPLVYGLRYKSFAKMSDPIYLDYASTTPVDESVIAAMSECFRRVSANPASQHQAGRSAKRAFDDASERIATWLGGSVQQARGDRLIVTSGGTEANNLALLGTAQDRPAERMIISAIEHPSSLAAAEQLRAKGWQVDQIRALEDGRIDLNHLESLLNEPSNHEIQLVSVMMANNETGVIQPLDEVVKLCNAKEISVHTDAVQAVGKLLIDFRQLGLTMMTIAAHKFHGPCGIGGLLISDVNLNPILHGGSQQLGTRPGTETVALLEGMSTALGDWVTHREQRSSHLAACRDRLQAGLLSECDGAVVNGTAERVPQTLNIAFPGLDRQTLLMALDFAGIYCSTGSACASGSSEPSHVLQAMGLSEARIGGSIRLSVGMPTSLAEIDEAILRISSAVKQLRT